MGTGMTHAAQRLRELAVREAPEERQKPFHLRQGLFPGVFLEAILCLLRQIFAFNLIRHAYSCWTLEDSSRHSQFLWKDLLKAVLRGL